MSIRRIRRAALLVALVILFAHQPPAHAVTAWNAGHTSMGQRCSWGVVHISNEIGSPAMWTKATVDDSVNNWCDNPNFVGAQGTLAVKQDLMAWHQPPNGAPGWWFLCNQGDWYINDWPSHEWNTAFSWGVRPCGTQWFYAKGYSSVQFAGRWHGFNVPINTGWIVA